MSMLNFAMSIWIFFVVVMVTCVVGSRYKRLVLHSDTGLVGESTKQQMTDEIEKLRQEMTEENAKLLHQMSKENAKLQQAMTEENAKLRLTITKQQQGSETTSTYVRWGKNSCPQNGTSMVYKGYMAGKHYQSSGSGTNSLCLPNDPTWGNYQDGWQSGRAYIYGTEYESESNTIFGKPVGQQDAPCAVCKVPGVSVMIPARVNCYPGWKLEYTGYLMAHADSHQESDYVCVDADPDFTAHADGAANLDGHILYPVESRCGSLPCPPYTAYRELACVVCSM